MRTASLVLAAAVLAACASTTLGQHAQLLATYDAVAKQLIDLRTHGFISDEEWGRAKVADRAFWAARGEFREGRGTLAAIRAALSELVAIQQKAKVSSDPRPRN